MQILFFTNSVSCLMLTSLFKAVDSSSIALQILETLLLMHAGLFIGNFGLHFMSASLTIILMLTLATLSYDYYLRLVYTPFQDVAFGLLSDEFRLQLAQYVSDYPSTCFIALFTICAVVSFLVVYITKQKKLIYLILMSIYVINEYFVEEMPFSFEKLFYKEECFYLIMIHVTLIFFMYNVPYLLYVVFLSMYGGKLGYISARFLYHMISNWEDLFSRGAEMKLFNFEKLDDTEVFLFCLFAFISQFNIYSNYIVPLKRNEKRSKRINKSVIEKENEVNREIEDKKN
ncbi:hypothetical protein COBT_001060 [Conglomerata obtusa]